MITPICPKCKSKSVCVIKTDLYSRTVKCLDCDEEFEINIDAEEILNWR
jgi:transcription elongation factor Elf1